VEASNEMGQFQPFLDPFTDLYTWDPLYYRQVKLVAKCYVDLEGVKIQRYLIDNETWAVNWEYDNNIRGFANITAIKQSPVFLSLPHFFGCDPVWRSKLGGIKEPTFDDVMTIDVEPNTGKTLAVKKHLQVNIHIEQNTNQLLYFNPKFPRGIIFPLVHATESTRITSEIAEEIKNGLYLPLTIRSLLFPIFIPLGCFFSIATFFLFVSGYWGFTLKRRPRKEKYININEIYDE